MATGELTDRREPDRVSADLSGLEKRWDTFERYYALKRG
jgi:hypothetical protein